MHGTSQPLRVLIAGAGIAGPVHAFWLSKIGAEVTVVERVDRLRKEGQTVDVRYEGRQIIDLMGITAAVKEVTTKEEGLKFVDSTGGVWGSFPQDGSASFTSEIEIVRGELAAILYEQTKGDTKYIFGDTIQAVEQDAKGVDVTFSRDGRTERFDLLVIADGLSSRTRALAFKQDVQAPIRTLDEWYCGFSFPRSEADDDWARWYNAPGRRVALHRPDGSGRMRSGFAYIDKTDSTRQISSSKTPIQVQKEYWAGVFRNAGWETDRLVQGMMQADDYYMYEVAQVKMDKWSVGRVALIGDAASCPSPITGQGTNCAIVQAYELAASIAKHPRDHRRAFEDYESRVRPWLEKVQVLPPGAPAVAVPNTSTAIFILHCVTAAAAFIIKTGLGNFLQRYFGNESNRLKIESETVFDMASQAE